MPEPTQTQAPAAASASPTPLASIKAFLSQQGQPRAPEKEPETDAEARPPKVAPIVDSQALSQAPETTEEPATREDVETEEVDPDDEPIEDDATEETELQLSSLKDLAEATELDLEKVMDLSVPTKIDGKTGTASIRDLLKSYQLDGHINQKLAALDTDRKTFETKQAAYEKAAGERLRSMERGIQVLERSLVGEFQSIDWNKLQAENPAQFNASYVGYQQRFGQLQQLSQQISAEKQTDDASRQAKAKSWSEEQRTLLKAKIPEWSDDKKRAQDKAAIADYVKGYGVTPEELDSLEDHRFALILRDAWKYGELQKQRPATLKKVKAAPKLLRPGSKQSRESRESLAAKGDSERLARSGRVRDAAPILKRLLGAQR